MPDCPYGTQYVGDTCMNQFGYTTCPVGHRFDSVQGKCTPNNQTNSKCAPGKKQKIDEFGEVFCEDESVQAIDSNVNNESQPTKPSRTTASQKPSKIKSCRAAHIKAKNSCFPTTNTAAYPSTLPTTNSITNQNTHTNAGTHPSNTRLQTLSNQFNVFKDTGNILQACESARDIASLNVVANVNYSMQCLGSARTCLASCDTSNAPVKEREELGTLSQECSSYKTASNTGISQIQLSAQTYLKSKACTEIASSDCSGANAQYSSHCVHYCAQNNNASLPQCKLANQNCQNMNFYQSNNTFCDCLKNPYSQSCSTAKFTDLNTSALSTEDAQVIASLKKVRNIIDPNSDPDARLNNALNDSTQDSTQATNSPTNQLALTNQNQPNQQTAPQLNSKQQSPDPKQANDPTNNFVHNNPTPSSSPQNVTGVNTNQDSHTDLETTPYYGTVYPSHPTPDQAALNHHDKNSRSKSPTARSQLRHHSYGNTAPPELAPIDADPSSHRAIASAPQTHYFKFFSLFCMVAAFFVGMRIYDKRE